MMCMYILEGGIYLCFQGLILRSKASTVRSLDFFLQKSSLMIFTGVAQKDHALASMSVKKDDRLFLNIAHANLDVSES